MKRERLPNPLRDLVQASRKAVTGSVADHLLEIVCPKCSTDHSRTLCLVMRDGDSLWSSRPRWRRGSKQAGIRRRLNLRSLSSRTSLQSNNARIQAQITDRQHNNPSHWHRTSAHLHVVRMWNQALDHNSPNICAMEMCLKQCQPLIKVLLPSWSMLISSLSFQDVCGLLSDL